jgi:hypothetical protein
VADDRRRQQIEELREQQEQPPGVELTSEELFAFVRQVVDHQVKDALKDIHQRLADLEMFSGVGQGAPKQQKVKVPGGVPWYTG